MSTQRISGPPSLDAYRAAARVPSVGAPSEATARGVWGLVAPELRVHGAVVQLDAVATAFLPKLGPAERERAELTAMKALVVAIDACMCAGRDRRNLYINTVFGALAKRWSSTFRDAETTPWEMKEETAKTARRELLEAGIDLDRIWPAVREGIAGWCSDERRHPHLTRRLRGARRGRDGAGADAVAGDAAGGVGRA